MAALLLATDFYTSQCLGGMASLAIGHTNVCSPSVRCCSTFPISRMPPHGGPARHQRVHRNSGAAVGGASEGKPVPPLVSTHNGTLLRLLSSGLEQQLPRLPVTLGLYRGPGVAYSADSWAPAWPRPSLSPSAPPADGAGALGSAISLLL